MRMGGIAPAEGVTTFTTREGMKKPERVKLRFFSYGFIWDGIISAGGGR